MGGCDGPGCAYRPLPLDRSLSASCRLSIEYMLKQEKINEQVSNALGFMTVKAKAFKEHCAEDKKVWHLKSHARCLRNAGHLLQVAEFINAAQANIGKSVLSETAENKLQKAGMHFASALGENGNLILELLQAVRKNATKILASDPETTMTLVVSTVLKLA